MDAAALARLAAAQRGLFTRAQARACGYSAYQIRRRLERGEWCAVLGPVLVSTGSGVPPRDIAAHLAVPGSVLAGPSAARLHGIPVPAAAPCLLVRPGTHVDWPGIRGLRDPVQPTDVTRFGRLLVTTRPRTVFDCVRVLPDPAALDLLDRALQQRWTTLDDFVARVHAFVGRRGAARMARMARVAGSRARSAAERVAVRLLRQAGLTGWRPNVEIRDRSGALIGIGDIVFGQAHVVIEVDGRAHHVTPEQFERDRARQNRLVAEGWTVLRFTWRDLTRRPGHVVELVRRMIAISCGMGE